MKGFNYDLERIPREENSRADALAKLANANATVNNRMIIQETLHTPCIKKVMCIETELLWMTLIIHYLKMGKLPQNKQDVRKIEHRSAYFFIKNDQLYKKCFALPSLRCLTPKEANYVLREIHEGICRS